MGETAEVLSREFRITRETQDLFALASHQRAIAARPRLREEIVPTFAPPAYAAVTDDVGPREGQTLEQLGKLKPYFDRKHGTVTVGNSCQVTDGAAALLVAGEETMRSWPTPPLGRIRAYAFAGLSPRRMGLGPVFAMSEVLRRTGLALADCELFEINEAFAAQVLACRGRRRVRHVRQGGARPRPGARLDPARDPERERRRHRARAPGRRERRPAPAHDPDGDAAAEREARARVAVRRRRPRRGVRAGARLMGIFRVEPGTRGIAHLVMDDPKRRINVLDEPAIADLEQALAALERPGDVRGVIVRSGKPGSFVAGADVHAIATVTERERVREMVRRAHTVFERLARAARAHGRGDRRRVPGRRHRAGAGVRLARL